MKLNKFFLFKLLIFIVFLLTSLIIYDMYDNNTYYVNKNPSFKFENIRNPTLRKIVSPLVNYKKNKEIKKLQKNGFYKIEDQKKRRSLKDKIIIEKAKLEELTPSNEKNQLPINHWARSNKNSSSNRFVTNARINKNNIKNLKIDWIYKFENINSDIQSNPVIYKDNIITPSTNRSIISINLITGKRNWEYKTKNTPARRGLVIKKFLNDDWIYFCEGRYLVSLNFKNGMLNKNFGTQGKVRLKGECKIAPIIHKNELIIATFEPAVNVYNVQDGKLKWKFFLREQDKRYNYQYYNFKGGNPWGGISLDENRSILYVTTGNPSSFFIGVDRPGSNLYANSVIAIDLTKKKKLWHFQETSHDLWNLDCPSPPILSKIKIKKKKYDVVVVVTKRGNTLILDRLNGKSLFDYSLKKFESSNIAGEKTSIYQKVFTLPEPFSKSVFSDKEITNISKESKKFIEKKIQGYQYGLFKPNSLDKKNIQFNFHGGAEWPGASIDEKKNIMFVASNNFAFITWIEKKTYNKKTKLISRFEPLLDKDGFPGNKPPWGNLTALNLNNGKIIWQVPFGTHEVLKNKGIFNTGSKNLGGTTALDTDIIFVSGTIDKKIYAYDSINGNILWDYKMKFIGSSSPTIYEASNKKTYLLIPSTGSITLKNTFPEKVQFGNYFYAFSIKN